MSKIRIDRVLQYSGFGSRKDVQPLLRSGRAKVNGVSIVKPDFKLDPWEESLTVDGKPVEFRPVLAVLLNKPAGYLSATEDSKGPTVLDLLDDGLKARHLSPAGRLDKDSTGLLLLTDDGEAVHRLLSPKTHTEKTYRVILDKPAEPADVEAFREGIVFSDFTSLPAELTLCDKPREALVTLHEGKFHQVKRMFHARGKEVQTLHREKFAGLTLPEELKPGEYLVLTSAQWEAVRVAAGLQPHPEI